MISICNRKLFIVIIDRRRDTKDSAKARSLPSEKTMYLSSAGILGDQIIHPSETMDGYPTQEWRVITQPHRIGSLLPGLIRHNLSFELPTSFNIFNGDRILYLHTSLDSSYSP